MGCDDGKGLEINVRTVDGDVDNGDVDNGDVGTEGEKVSCALERADGVDE